MWHKSELDVISATKWRVLFLQSGIQCHTKNVIEDDAAQVAPVILSADKKSSGYFPAVPTKFPVLQLLWQGTADAFGHQPTDSGSYLTGAINQLFCEIGPFVLKLDLIFFRQGRFYSALPMFGTMRLSFWIKCKSVGSVE